MREGQVEYRLSPWILIISEPVALKPMACLLRRSLLADLASYPLFGEIFLYKSENMR